MFVNGFSIEAKTPTGKWVRAPVFDVHPPKMGPVVFYMVPEKPSAEMGDRLWPDFKDASEISFEDNFLQDRLSRNPLNPFEPVQGWVLLDIPKDGWTGEFRFSLMSGTGKLTKDMQIAVYNPNGMDVQTTQYEPHFRTLQHTDISRYPVRFYGDGLNPNTNIFK